MVKYGIEGKKQKFQMGDFWVRLKLRGENVNGEFCFASEM